MDIKLDINELIKKPVFLLILGAVGLGGYYLQYVKPEKVKNEAKENNAILELTRSQVELKTELRLLRAQKVAQLEEVAQGFIGAQPLEAWATYWDPETDQFKFLAINDAYAERYGTCFDVLGKTIPEAYSCRQDMSQEETDLLDAYNVNNERALALNSKCIVFTEWVIPLNKEPVRDKFRKCGLRSGTILIVYGEREL